MQFFHFSLLLIFITGLNPSEEYPDPSPVSHTHSDGDLASSSRGGGSVGVTRLPDTFGSVSVSVRQGGGYAGPGDDNTRIRVVPQEVTHNGQEKAGSAISDLAHTATHSHTDSSDSPGRRPNTDTSGGLNTEKLPDTTAAHSDTPHDTDAPLIRSEALDTLNSKIFHRGDITVMSSAPTSTRSYVKNRATVAGPQTSDSDGFYHVTDAAVMSSTFTANGDRIKFRTDDHFNRNLPDLSVTGGFLSDTVSDLKVSEADSVTYVSDGAVMSSTYTHTAGTGASRTSRLPRSTHTNKNVSNGTSSWLIDDSSTVTHTPTASLSHRHLETSSLSHASEGTTTAKKQTERYPYTTPYYTGSLNTHSTPTQTTATNTIHNEVFEQTTHQHVSETNTHPSASSPQSDSDTSTRQDFISTSASTLSDSTTSNTHHTSFHTSLITTITPAGPTTTLYDALTDISSVPVSEEQTENDNTVTETYTITSDSHHHVTSVRPMTVTLDAPSSPSSSPSSSPRNDPATPPVTPPLHSTSPAPTFHTTTANTPPAKLYTNQTSRNQTTTPQAEIQNPEHLTTSRNSQIIQQHTHTVHTNTLSETYAPSTSWTKQTSSPRTVTTKTYKDRSHSGRVFITADQPAIIKVETFQLLLQVILEEDTPPNARLLEVEPFLHNVAGYQSQHVTWHSGPVLQSVLMFRTVETVTWLERAETLLQEAGLNPLPPQGFFVSGTRVKNITVGGLHSDVCSWLFFCPPEFSCVFSEGNVTCRSVCHSEFCKNHGICVHRSGQNPVCQCPVGEDFWFMGQRCDLRMTRQRLAGVCFGVLATLAALMGLLSYLAVQRFKKMLLQAKTEQTQSSYRRFNHFDELSARFWKRSWPGSQDSLDQMVFSRSDELLHMRALDRPCCYHDDTLSIASTYPDSVTRLNTVYPHSSQYQWDMSTCSLADGVVDSGKASDLSVCSWPIEPIQWTPFPLLQQLRNTNTMKVSRPRSYCEGMELVGLEKSRTA